VTHVYRDSTAAKAGVQVGDLILAVDGTKMTANRPEDGEDLAAFIRQYTVGATAELQIRRRTEELKTPVELVRAPKLAREMKRFRDDVFEFTVRDITMFDIASERWREDQQGVLVEQVRPGGWAALGQVHTGDLLLEINGAAMSDVTAVKDTMTKVAESMADSVVFKVLRGIHTVYIELEPRWDKKQGG
jgi:serine protease Do